MRPRRASGPRSEPTGPTARLRSSRRRLGTAQAGLLWALAGQGPAPQGFAADDVDAVADVRARKRAQAVRDSVPELTVTPVFRRGFVAWARRHPLAGPGARTGAGAVADARAFFRSLPVAGRPAGTGVAMVAAWLHDRRPWWSPVTVELRPTAGGPVLGVRVGQWRVVVGAV